MSCHFIVPFSQQVRKAPPSPQSPLVPFQSEEPPRQPRHQIPSRQIQEIHGIGGLKSLLAPVLRNHGSVWILPQSKWRDHRVLSILSILSTVPILMIWKLWALVQWFPGFNSFGFTGLINTIPKSTRTWKKWWIDKPKKSWEPQSFRGSKPRFFLLEKHGNAWKTHGDVTWYHQKQWVSFFQDGERLSMLTIRRRQVEELKRRADERIWDITKDGEIT